MRLLIRQIFLAAFYTILFGMLTPVTAQQGGAEEIVVRSQDNNILCLAGDRVLINGTFNTISGYDDCVLSVDGLVVSERTPSLGTDSYAFRWTASSPGTHVVQVFYTAQPRRKVIGRRLLVNVLSAPPASFQGLLNQAVADVPVTVTVSPSQSFALARVEFYFRDKFVASSSVSPFTATLPIEAVSQQGIYPFRFVAYDSSGRIFHSRLSQIEVPQRVSFSSDSNFTFQKSDDRLPLSVTLKEGVKAAKVDYFIAHSGQDDWQNLTQSASGPFSAPADVSRFATGAYRLKATVTSSNGTAYESQPVDVTLKNVPDDDRLAKAAQDKANADALIAKQQAITDAKQAAIIHVASERAANLENFFPRPGFDATIFRQQLAELAFYEPEKRFGMIGTVHGLSVLAINGVPQSGAPTTITAIVRAGTGQVNFLANSEEDSRITAQQAAEYCKLATGSYFRWDWTKYDITIGYLENDIKHSGPSAGLADAVSIMSAAVNKPVDGSVAMTGAITLQGQVKAVGGVTYKAESAFADTNVHTLIIPAESIPIDELRHLYTSEPALCFNRRIVLVRTADEAMRQAIMGWQNSDYLKSEKLVQGGLRHFAKGEDNLALAAFHAALDLDPNNWTITFWISIVRSTSQEARNDAAIKGVSPASGKVSVK